MGDGYPSAGNYNGTHNRTMTVIGSPEAARRGWFIKRAAVPDHVKKQEYTKMNMTHFYIARNQAASEHSGIHTSCFAEVYRRTRMRDEDAVLRE